MSKIKNFHNILLLSFLLIIVLLISACSNMGQAIDPGDWHYDCVVIYDALGGTINSRDIRETYYMDNSYLFEPSGTTNMLIQPIKDGYILAGWYTSKEDITDKDGNIVGYSFKAEDRWDFDEDRVQENMTLYARWILQGKVDYVDASTDTIKFSKNITVESPVQKLSKAAESLISKEGHTLYNYFSDKQCTVPYNFSEYVHTELIPSDQELYDQLYGEFPEYFNKIEYVELPESKDERPIEEDTTDLYINKLGYEIATDDKAARHEIRTRKDEIIEGFITNYENNSSKKTVYLKYIEGKYIRVDHVENLKVSGKYGFTGKDISGKPIDGYILTSDIDFKDAAVDMVESFSGKIYGNGFSIKNIKINVSSRKLDKDTSKVAGIFKSLKGAHIEDVVFEGLTINLSVQPGIPVTVGALSVEANNTTLKNVSFDTLKINTGRGDDGSAEYRIYDLFASETNNTLDNVTGNNIEISATEFAKVNQMLLSPMQ